MYQAATRYSRLTVIARFAFLSFVTLGNSACISLFLKESGGIQVTSNVPAAVLVDGREVGMTPMHIYPASRNRWDPRTPLNITVMADGYMPVTQRVTRQTDWKFVAKGDLPYLLGASLLLAAGLSIDEFGDPVLGPAGYGAIGLYGVWIVDNILGKGNMRRLGYSHPVIRAELVPDPD